MFCKRSLKIIPFIFCFLFAKDALSRSNVTDSLLLLTKNHRDDTALVNLYVDLGKAFRNKLDYTNAKLWVQKSIDLSEKINFVKGKTNGYCQLGNVFLYAEEYAEATRTFQGALSVSREMKDEKNICNALYGLCFAEYKANHYDAAEKFCLQTIDCVNQLKDSALLVKA